MRTTFDRCNKGLFLKVHRYTIVYYNCGSLRKFSLILENMTWSVYGIICFSILAGRTHLDATITSENIFRGGLVFLQMIHNKKLFREPSVKYRTFSEDPTWSDLKLKSRLKLSKNYSIHGKIVKFLVRIISEHPLKVISLIFGTEIVGPCLVWKFQWLPPCSI